MTPQPQRHYSPRAPYDVKGSWVRHDLLAMVPATPRRVLSIGCGTGDTEVHLQQRGAEVTGVDVCAESVAIARPRLTNVLIGDVEQDPLPELQPRSFDLILCGDVLEHLRFTEHVLDRLRSWVADDGLLVVSVPNATHHSVLRQLAFHRDWKYEDAGLFDRGHYRLFTKRSLLRLLGEHGFRVEQVECLRQSGTKERWLRRCLWPLLWLFPGLDEYFVQTWTVRARPI
jgi:trans-aconitate methyltransferase